MFCLILYIFHAVHRPTTYDSTAPLTRVPLLTPTVLRSVTRPGWLKIQERMERERNERRKGARRRGRRRKKETGRRKKKENDGKRKAAVYHEEKGLNPLRRTRRTVARERIISHEGVPCRRTVQPKGPDATPAIPRTRTPALTFPTLVFFRKDRAASI